MKIKVDIKVPSQRDYKRMIWELREAMKFAMIEATRRELLLNEKPEEPSETVAIGIGGRVLPENCHISPVIWVLRKDGYITDNCAITLVPVEMDGVTIAI